MDLFTALRNFFDTDVVFEIAQSPESRYRQERSDARDGALTVCDDGDRLRLVFHGAGLGGGGVIVLEDGEGNRLTLSRDDRRQVSIIMTAMSGPVLYDEKVRKLSVGGKLTFTDPAGRTITVARIRHRDFQLFPVPA